MQDANADSLTNPRTGLPYVRGKYNKNPSGSAAAQISKLEREQLKANKAAAAGKEAAEQTASLRSEIAILKSENTRLTKALEEVSPEDTGVEEAKKTAMLEAGQKTAEQLLDRYRDGLRDGASLASGRMPNLSSSTPDSANLGVSPR